MNNVSVVEKQELNDTKSPEEIGQTQPISVVIENDRLKLIADQRQLKEIEAIGRQATPVSETKGSSSRKVKLKNDAGLLKTVPVGFSWSMFFLGPLVPLFRGDLKWMFLHIFLSLFYGLGWIILPFLYNKRYLVNLLERGYRPADEESRIILLERGVIVE